MKTYLVGLTVVVGFPERDILLTVVIAILHLLPAEQTT